MRKKDPRPQQQTAKRERSKTSCTVSARLKQVVDQMLTCDEEQYAAAVQQVTVFVFKSQQSELVTAFLEDMRRENGALFRNRDALMHMVARAYDSILVQPPPSPSGALGQ